jgi:transglutaminase-like putative cysteine protease
MTHWLIRRLLAAALLVSAAPFAAGQAPNNIFDAKAAALEARFRAAGPVAEQAALLGQLYDLRPLVDDRAALAAFFAAVAAEPGRTELVGEEATRYAAAARGAALGAPSAGLLAEARAEAESGEPHALDALARLEDAASTGTPLEHMLAAARREPAAERWLLVARWSDQQAQIFAALSQATTLAPDSADVRLAFADYYAGRGQTRKALDLLRPAAQRASADFRAQWRLAELEATLGHDEIAQPAFVRLAREFPRPLWMLLRAAQHGEEDGRLAQAETLLRALLSEEPRNFVARAQLARVLERRRDANGLRMLYEQSAALDPHDPEPRRRLATLAGEWPREVAAIPADRDEQYFVDAAGVARAAQREPAAAAEGALSLAEIRVERVSETGMVARRFQQLLLITSHDEARAYATREVQYAPASEQLKILHARIFKRDGRRVDAVEAGERSVADAGVSIYYDARLRALRYRGLEPGDVLELEYRTTPYLRGNPYGAYLGQLIPFQSALRQRLQRYVVIAPETQPLHIASERMPQPRITAAAGERRYQWERRDLPALAGEPRAPALTEVAPYVHVSGFASWQELGRWYAALLGPQLALDDDLRAALAQALRGAKDEPAKIRAIHELVVKQTHYVALEFGVYGYKPYPVAQTFARRFGDCKDKASLMIALLRETGIAAEFALVRTRRLGRVSERAASISVFDHAIVYLPKYDLWLDGTAEYSGARELPLEDQGAMALTVALDGRAALRHIPATAPADNYTRRTVRAELRSDGRLEFSGTAYTRGEDAPGLRREYEVAERQRDSFRARLAEVLPAVQVEAVDVEGAHSLAADVTVNFRGTLDSFAGRRSVVLASTWMPRAYLQTLAPLAQRSQPLLLPAPWTTEEELRVTLPRNAEVGRLPAPRRIATDFGSAQLSYELRGRELLIHTEVQFRETRIAPEEYAAFRDFCAEVERAFREEVRVGLR